MKFERILSTSHPFYERATQLYQTSFPLHEQREPASQAEILSDPDYRFNLICDGERFAGLLLAWETEDFIYIEHLCISPEMRNQKYGQRALELLKRQGKPIILEIDPPADPISTRRKGFYQRNGFAMNPYPHRHPPYRKGNAGHCLAVLSHPRELTPDEYAAFRQYLENRVMKDAIRE